MLERPAREGQVCGRSCGIVVVLQHCGAHVQMTQYVTEARRELLPALHLSAEREQRDIGNECERRTHSAELAVVGGERPRIARCPGEQTAGERIDQRARGTA